MFQYPEEGRLKIFERVRAPLNCHNSRSAAHRKKILVSNDSEHPISYLSSIHYLTVTASENKKFSKNAFYYEIEFYYKITAVQLEEYFANIAFL